MTTLRIIDNDENEPSQPLCNICQKQFSNYVCPRCNVKYCSLACYKDLQHTACTESFYKDNVMAKIPSGNQDLESQKKMMEILRRQFEVENETAPSDEELDSLVQRFSNIDIENADTDIIWELLSPEERSNFESILTKLDHPSAIKDDPSLWEDLFSDLSAYQPWWLSTIPLIEEALIDSDGLAPPPILPDLPITLPNFEDLCKDTSSMHLLWNLLNILLTYCYLLRHLMGDIRDDVKSTVRIIKFLSADVLFSTEKDCAYSCVCDVLDDVVNRIKNVEFEDGRHNIAPASWYDKIKLTLLGDVEKLLAGAKSQYMVRALADLCDTLQIASQNVKKVMRAHRKSYFYLVYAAYVCKASEQLGTLQSLVEIERNRVAREKQVLDTQNTAAIEVATHIKKRHDRIVELA